VGRRGHEIATTVAISCPRTLRVDRRSRDQRPDTKQCDSPQTKLHQSDSLTTVRWQDTVTIAKNIHAPAR
jgi:hypothetical protein